MKNRMEIGGQAREVFLNRSQTNTIWFEATEPYNYVIKRFVFGVR